MSVILACKGETEADIKARIQKARRAITQLGEMWRATKILKKLRRTFQFNFESQSGWVYNKSQDHPEKNMG